MYNIKQIDIVGQHRIYMMKSIYRQFFRANGMFFKKEGLVWTDEIITLNNRHFLPALKITQIPRTRLHGLRHSNVSLLIEQGENLKYIQSQLGHASPMVTLTVYAHLMSPVNPEAASRLENAIFGTSGSKMVAKNKKGVNAWSVNPWYYWCRGTESNCRHGDFQYMFL